MIDKHTYIIIFNESKLIFYPKVITVIQTDFDLTASFTVSYVPTPIVTSSLFGLNRYHL